LAGFEQISAVLFERPIELNMFTYILDRHKPNFSPHGTNLIPPEGFAWNFILCGFRKSADEIQVQLKSKMTNGHFKEDTFTFMIISGGIIVRMENCSDKRRREIQNTQVMFNNLFKKSRRSRDNVQKMIKPYKTKMTINYGACALHA
jgi:hypothetical protein